MYYLNIHTNLVDIIKTEFPSAHTHHGVADGRPHHELDKVQPDLADAGVDLDSGQSVSMSSGSGGRGLTLVKV